MKKISAILASVLLIVASCEEWDPVVTLEYDEPEAFTPVTRSEMEAKGKIITISELAKMYTVGRGPVDITTDLLICGKVSSSDQSGNIYKSFYLQDDTGGIEIKVGRYSLYNIYKPGQTVYVYLNGLTIGMYGYKTGNYGGNGMLQVGMSDPTGEYETSYMELPNLVDSHIFRGELGTAVTPKVITASDLPTKSSTINTCPYLGELVTLKGLTYGKEVFALVYLTYNKDTKLSSNRIFLSDNTWGITTWAMSKTKMSEYLESGIWDSVSIGNSGDYSYGTVGEMKGSDPDDLYPNIQRNAYSVSQYFKMGSKEIQIRSSGYGDFADLEIPADILSGSKTLSVTGILSLYQGSIQFSAIDQDSFTYTDTGASLY